MIRVESKTQAGNQIITVQDLTDDDRKELINNYELTSEFIRYATDPLERARVEYNEFTQTWLIVYYVSVVATAESQRIVQPVSLIIKRNDLFVFVTTETNYILSEVSQANLNDQTRGVWDSVLTLLYQVTTAYFDHIQSLTEQRMRIDQNLHLKDQSKHIFELADLGTSLTYLLTAANGNLVAIGQLKSASSHDDGLALDKLSRARLDDIAIEARQAQEMLELNSDIVDKMSNTYNNLLNNNLNQVMKLLTIYSVVLMIPPIVFGFYGMNMQLPIADQSWSWIFSVVISILPIIWVIYRLKHDHFL